VTLVHPYGEADGLFPREIDHVILAPGPKIQPIGLDSRRKREFFEIRQIPL
jgi:hypothetical protein